VRPDAERLGFFVSDLHGRADRYAKLVAAVARERPAAVFLGGDLLPHGFAPRARTFFDEVLATPLRALRARLGEAYPRVFAILGNDDPRVEESALGALEAEGLLEYVHGRGVPWGAWTVYGYACVPPTPFLLKDWEVYDVSRYVDPGCVSPEEGRRTVAVAAADIRTRTIASDLDQLVPAGDLDAAIMLFHTPPYRTALDRAALDHRRVEHVPVDVHVGSVAVRRFIEARQPRVTLHGHVHESPRLTGAWRERLGRTWAFSAAHDGPELALVRFDPAHPEAATRELL
jgi:Icc-related predicted phosphoesterase